MPGGEFPIPTPSSDDRQIIFCIYCSKPQEIGKKALSVTCKYCNKSLRIEDLRFKEYQARRTIETVGMVTVEKRRKITCDLCRRLADKAVARRRPGLMST